MSTYNPTDSRFLTVANSMTNTGTKNIKLILDIIDNYFYTLDDNNNFLAIQFQPPTLSFYLTGNTSATTITSANTWYNFASNVAPILQYQSQLNNGLHVNLATGKVEYTGETRWFSFQGHVEVSAGNNQEIDIALFKNGTISPGSTSHVVTSSGGKTSSIPGMVIVELNNGDICDIRVNNNTASTNITVKSLNILIQAI
jgi:hypothetical protein